VSPLRGEVRKLLSLGAPVAGAQLATMLLGFVDTAVVGRVSVEAMAAASLANVWIFGTLMFGHGVIFGLDPIVAQAHGAGDGARAGRALQHGIAVAGLLSVPIALLWLGTEHFLRLAGQDPALARAAHEFTLVQIPSIPFFLAFAALRQYLQGRELVRPALWVMIAANVWNLFFNWVFVFGHLGSPALGLIGSGIATCLSRILSFAGLVWLVLGFSLHRGAWVPWSREALDRRGLSRLVSIGLPVAVQMSLEIWAFSGAALLAGRLGAVPLAAHTVALNLAALAFMIPLGLSQGAATRVGNLIGARRSDDAQRAATLALGLGAGVMSASALAFVVFRHALPRIYTPDAAVIAAAAAVLPIAAAFQIFDGTQVVGCGILRAMGRVRPAATFNLIGYWILGLPIGGWLALRSDWGLAGIWWGLCFGLAVVASSLVLFVRYRGPRSATALVPTRAPAPE
jgi:MATE family multidrug resistance protein